MSADALALIARELAGADKIWRRRSWQPERRELLSLSFRSIPVYITPQFLPIPTQFLFPAPSRSVSRSICAAMTKASANDQSDAFFA